MEDFLLKRCKLLIEAQLGWGPAEEWSAQDFDELSIRMEDATGQVISSTTLKRVWGRVAYASKPSRHSLDTLAAFLGHASWREFATSEQAGLEQDTAENQIVLPQKSWSLRAPRTFALVMLLLGGSIVLWLGVNAMVGSRPEPMRSYHRAARRTFRSKPNSSAPNRRLCPSAS